MMIEKNKLLHFLIHLIGWGMVFGFPLFFTWKDGNPMTWEKYMGYVFVPVTFVIVFYLNYFLLIDRLLFRKQLVQFIAANLLLFVVLSVGLDLWQNYYFHHYVEPKPLDRHAPPRLMFLLRDGMMMMLTAGLSVAIRMTDNWYVVETEKKELEKARAEAELQNLKSQLNPHFLFNTLNNIYSLIAIDPDRAQSAVHDLSHLLRHVLYEEEEHSVPLDQELLFMKSYIDLMSLRLSDRVSLLVEMPAGGQGRQVAPLLFISLIENAFKHGVSLVEPSYIHIRFALPDSGKIFCRIENSFFPKKENDCSGSGIGLGNLQKRLALLYPGKHTLQAGRSGSKYIAELTIMEKQESGERTGENL